MSMTTLSEIDRTVDVMVRDKQFDTAMDIVDSATDYIEQHNNDETYHNLQYLEALRDFIKQKKVEAGPDIQRKVREYSEQIDHLNQQIESLTSQITHSRKHNWSIYIIACLPGILYMLSPLILTRLDCLEKIEMELQQFLQQPGWNFLWFFYDSPYVFDCLPPATATCLLTVAALILAILFITQCAGSIIRRLRPRRIRREIEKYSAQVRKLTLERQNLGEHL